MKVLVTGATGFVASHLIPALVRAGHEVVALGHDGARIPAGRRALVRPRRALDWPTLSRVRRGRPPRAGERAVPDGANALFAVNVAARSACSTTLGAGRASRFVYASSGSVYGARRDR